MNEEQQRYKKVGRRYVLVSWYDATDTWTPGSYLVTIQKTASGRSIHSERILATRDLVTPDYLALKAAAQNLESKLIDIVYEANKAKPATSTLTPTQVKAWRALEQSGINGLVGQSATTVAQEILVAIMSAAKGK